MLLKSRSGNSHQPSAHPSSCSSEGCRDRGAWERGQVPEWGTPPGQIIPGVQHGGLCPRAPSRAVGPISWGQTQGHRGSGSGWDGPEQGFGGAASSREPRGAGRGWEAVGELRGDPQWGHRAAADPVLTLGCTFTRVWYPHPLVTLAKRHTQDTASAPFLSFPFSLIPLLQPRHPALPPASPGHSHPDPPWCHRTPNTLPSPPGSEPPTSGLSSPGRVPGGLSPAGSISGGG